MTTDSIALAGALFAAIEGGDVDAVAALYAPDAVVWHNHDGVEQGVADNLRVLAWLVRATTARRYEVTRRIPTEDGFVQQHVLHLTTAAGRELAIPACLVVQVAGGRITRIDEYLDSAGFAPLLAG